MNHIEANNHREYFGQDGSFIEGLVKDIPEEKYDLYELYLKSKQKEVAR